MRVALMQKRMAVTSPIKEVQINGKFEDYYQDGELSESYWGRNVVNEELLLNNLPNNFLGSIKPESVAISVEMEIDKERGYSLGSRGQTNMEIFSPDERKYSLLLRRDYPTKDLF